MTVDPAQIPEFVSSRPAMYPPSKQEYKEELLFTAAAIWSELDIRAVEVLPAMYPKDFSRNEYGFSGDVLARLTRGKK